MGILQQGYTFKQHFVICIQRPALLASVVALGQSRRHKLITVFRIRHELLNHLYDFKPGLRFNQLLLEFTLLGNLVGSLSLNIDNAV